MVVCAGEGCGLPFPDADGEAVHFNGPADPAIKDHLDGGEWTTREDGSRLCYGCRRKEVDRPADGEMDNPLEGDVVHLERPCVLMCCDCCGDLLGGDEGVPHSESADGAESLADLHESDDRVMAVLDREVSELEGPVPDAEAACCLGAQSPGATASSPSARRSSW